jgi:hypothetical protein
LLVLVLALGVRVTKKNREWELKIAQQVQQQQKQQQQSRRESDLETVRQSVRATFEDAGDALDAPTYVIPVAKVVEREKAVQEPIAHEPAAVTPETPLSSSASPAPAAEQDLISFSLGGSPSHVGVDDVQSLEIRSQKQVARAVPVPPAAPAPTPVSASVSAPALTEDSLGVAIDEVLLRRRR